MRMLVLIAVLLAGLVATPAVQAAGTLPSGPAVTLQLIAEGFTHPLALQDAPDGSGRLFVVDQTGEIWILTADGNLLAEPFLDISGKLVDLTPDYDERGLLGLAFHPGYAGNGRFFVYYSAPLSEGAPDNFDHTNVLAEYSVSEGNPDQADPDSEIILLTEDWPYTNHNGGTLAFGPDGMLYLSWGDGGNRDDEGIGHVDDWYEANDGGNAQDIEQNPKGSLMRIDVSTPGTITVPADNPFAGQLGSDVLELQWAYGFRNPYRFSFDMGGSHEMIVGDAGQELWEEVDIVVKGGNYGWNIKEGTHCFDAENPTNPPESCPNGIPPTADHPDADAPSIDPVIEFANTSNLLVPERARIGLVVVGGYVYRGELLPQLSGRYFFGVWSRGEEETGEMHVHLPGRILVAKPRQKGLWKFQELHIKNSPDGTFQHFLLGFGQDLQGEIYVLATDEVGPIGNTGKIFRIASPAGAPENPSRISRPREEARSTAQQMQAAPQAAEHRLHLPLLDN